MKTLMILSAVLFAAAVVVGCDVKTTTVSKTETSETVATDAIPTSLIATTQPTAAAQDVAAAKKSLKDGDAVVVRGRVGGQKDPLADNRAIMTIADLSLPTCDKTPMDTCETPWDSCCQPAEELKAKSASVQVVGADGKPLKAGLKGAGGLAPGKEVVVAGTAKIPPGSDALVIVANQIYVKP
jgi:hypothetical protein